MWSGLLRISPHSILQWNVPFFSSKSFAFKSILCRESCSGFEENRIIYADILHFYGSIF